MGNHFGYNPNPDPVWQHGEEAEDYIEIQNNPPQHIDVWEIYPHEPLADFCRRVYGSNTNVGRQRILAANGGEFPTKGKVNVPR
jgi:hypothetical protein